MVRIAAVAATLVMGCGAAVAPPPSAPPQVDATPPPPPRAHPVVVAAPTVPLAQVVGRWHGVDDDHWEYDLEISADGTFTQLVHQQDPTAGGNDCQQSGTITAGDDELVRTFGSNDCNHDYDGKSVHDGLVQLDDAHLVLRMESDYLIRYDRAP